MVKKEVSMIFWVMLLTFVVSIMTLALYPREDMVNVQEKPLAEVPVRPFIDMHNMARQIAAAKVATGNATSGEILTGAQLPFYNQTDVNDFRSYLVCQRLYSEPDKGKCVLKKQLLLDPFVCEKDILVKCFNPNQKDANGNPDCQNAITDGYCKDLNLDGETWTVNFVVTYAPFDSNWNTINYGPNGSKGQLWNGELYRLSKKTGNCGVVGISGNERHILYPGGSRAVNTNAIAAFRRNNLHLIDGSMICQSPVPKSSLSDWYFQDGFWWYRPTSMQGNNILAQQRCATIGKTLIGVDDICTTYDRSLNECEVRTTIEFPSYTWIKDSDPDENKQFFIAGKITGGSVIGLSTYSGGGKQETQVVCK